MKKLKTLYGLPRKILFCKKTLMSNQRPTSEQEFTHNIKTRKKVCILYCCVAVLHNFISPPLFFLEKEGEKREKTRNSRPREDSERWKWNHQ